MPARVSGKFFFVGDSKLYVRGATYGAFRPAADGCEFTDTAKIEHDFALMAAHGMNAVRIPHTMPPISLLDAAARHGLKVMVGLSAEQYAGYLVDGGRPDVEQIVRQLVREVSGHPALLCYALGNEIPAATVRWLGRGVVERYLSRLYVAVKEEDPSSAVTYVNYPTTEYLDLRFLDLLSFNVYLEDPSRHASYLARLHSLAGDRPLLMSEIGLDALRNGEAAQAQSIEWQIRSTFASGCAGAFVFAWTDEWHRAGEQVDDWSFGLTKIDRTPKPALGAARRAFSEVPFGKLDGWPTISVVVCAYNAEGTIRECLGGVRRLDYPDFETIVVDDGSTDETASIVRELGIEAISTENRGLGSARNTGMAAATGEIVAYLDSDAVPDPHWLQYLAATFVSTDHVAVGGPNIPPEGSLTADCVARAPGGPIHVLLTDELAEHIPGCNMAIRRDALQKIGGFDERYRAAGDDVDACWRLQEVGGTIGFSPAAVVWHHRRGSVLAYWRQQQGYGKAEALLEQKWPERYNAAGHLRWSGRIYGNGLARPLRRRSFVYHGVGGSAPFRSLYERDPSLSASLLLMPEWWLVIASLAVGSGLGLSWRPLLACFPLLLVAVALVGAQALVSALAARFPVAGVRRRTRWKRRGLTAALHVVQPVARLIGRVRHDLSPWRRRGASFVRPRRRRSFAIWCEEWEGPSHRLTALQSSVRSSGVVVLPGGAFDDWDFEARAGAFGAARVLMAIEDHGAGAQYVRIRAERSVPRTVVMLVGALSAVGALALGDGGVVAGTTLLATAVGVAVRSALDCGVAMGAVEHAALRSLSTS